jgi:hypothetical protein
MKLRQMMRLGVSGGVLAALAVAISISGKPSAVRLIPMKRHHREPNKVHMQRGNSSWESYNWSGYSVTSANGASTDVTGSWIVPTVSCSQAPTGYSSFWIGIDGFSSSTVEQIGTDSDCVALNGRTTDTPTYYAWFEFYPAGSYVIGFPRGVKPGDLITAEVKYLGEGGNGRHGGSAPQFSATITDVTQGSESYTVTSTVANAAQSSVEWIAEAPCCSKGQTVLPLADFGTVSFSNGTATVGTTTAPISGFGTNVQSITMVGQKNPSLVKAILSSLSGSGFSVTWAAAGP